jgi:hypothetical protein
MANTMCKSPRMTFWAARGLANAGLLAHTRVS